jgi:hypothetical protein
MIAGVHALAKDVSLFEQQARVWRLLAPSTRCIFFAPISRVLFFTTPACNSNHRQHDTSHSAGDSDDGPEDAIPLIKPSSRGPLRGFHDAVMT